MKYPRFLLAAGASGSGKTLITCGILQAFCDRGLKTVSFKCGPDYIDPMFHARVIGAKSRNLDTFFTTEDTTRFLFTRNAEGADISVIEGVMGYYDGLAGISEKASAYDVARVTDTPVVLIVNAKGMSLSTVAYIKGFLEFMPDSHIRGVILNQVSAMMYPQLKQLIEEKLGIKVYGYVPVVKELNLESRHLGLVMPDEIEDLQTRLGKLGQILEETLDLDGLLKMAGDAPDLQGTDPAALWKDHFADTEQRKAPVIAVAKDEAFCFFYEDNMELLRFMGAKIRYFSPLRDEKIPEADGAIFYGGYPELYAEQLQENESMRESIRQAVKNGMPVLAECGGFMYLQEEMEDMEGKAYQAVGALPGKAYKTPKLGRFGYITLEANQEQMLGKDIGAIKAHEFHYFDSTQCGEVFHAQKPLRKRGWDCIQGSSSMIAGFPHLYYYSNPKIALRFLETCVSYSEQK